MSREALGALLPFQESRHQSGLQLQAFYHIILFIKGKTADGEMVLLSKSATESQNCFFYLFLLKKKKIIKQLCSDILTPPKKKEEYSGKGQSSAQKDEVFEKTIMQYACLQQNTLYSKAIQPILSFASHCS